MENKKELEIISKIKTCLGIINTSYVENFDYYFRDGSLHFKHKSKTHEEASSLCSDAFDNQHEFDDMVNLIYYRVSHEWLSMRNELKNTEDIKGEKSGDNKDWDYDINQKQKYAISFYNWMQDNYTQVSDGFVKCLSIDKTKGVVRTIESAMELYTKEIQ
jgi:hypothetical protein